MGLEIKCGYCGIPFVPVARNGKYCSKECRQKAGHKKLTLSNKSFRNEEVPKKKKRNTDKKMSISEACREAKKLGMSYGQYMATRSK